MELWCSSLEEMRVINDGLNCLHFVLGAEDLKEIGAVEPCYHRFHEHAVLAVVHSCQTSLVLLEEIAEGVEIAQRVDLL